MTPAIVGMNVKIMRLTKGLLDRVSHDPVPGGIQKGEAAILVDLEHDLLQLTDEIAVACFAFARRFVGCVLREDLRHGSQRSVQNAQREDTDGEIRREAKHET